MHHEGPDKPEERRSDERTEPTMGPDEGREERDIEGKQLHDLQRARQARVARAFGALGIGILLIIFVIANSQQVKVDFVFFTRQPRLIWVMIACALLGGIAGYLIGRPGKQVRIPRRKGEEAKGRG
jgi:uncharacterized integral membrane protein